jgi:hypothetical protein
MLLALVLVKESLVWLILVLALVVEVSDDVLTVVVDVPVFVDTVTVVLELPLVEV